MDRPVVGAREEVFDVGSVEVGSLYLVRAGVRPVHLPAWHVQRQAIGLVQAAGHQVLHVRAIKVGPLNLVRAPVRPVHLPSGSIHRVEVFAGISSATPAPGL